MGHKTKIGGTNYEVYSGKLLKGGTSYSVVKGKTKIGGTGHDVNFKKKYTATLHGLYGFIYMDVVNMDDPYMGNVHVEIDGTRYSGQSSYNVTVYEDTEITVWGLWQTLQNNGTMPVYLNGTKVASGGNYSFIPTGNVEITCSTYGMWHDYMVEITMA